ncbi:MAG: helix-turn-helix domain-containing protein [Nanoarchaeota archaeon]|nr:helix-turn-helix domain-containing protein [Nanoarchaeota archaeon]
MWLCKFKIYDEHNIFRKLVEKNKVELYYYPVNYYIKKNRYFFIVAGIIRGDNKNKFFSDLMRLKEAKKGRKIELLEREGDFFTMISSHDIYEEEKKYVNSFYNPAIIHHKPIIFHKDGWEEWEIFSLERDAIEDIINIGKEVYDLKLLSLHKRKIKNFGFLTILPELTAKQENALKLALEFGYYNYPRKISLDKLAKIAKLSFSTFQAHVRKAENKILSFLIGSFKK